MEYYYAMQANRGELAPQDKMRYFGRDLTNLESEDAVSRENAFIQSRDGRRNQYRRPEGQREQFISGPRDAHKEYGKDVIKNGIEIQPNRSELKSSGRRAGLSRPSPVQFYKGLFENQRNLHRRGNTNEDNRSGSVEKSNNNNLSKSRHRIEKSNKQEIVKSKISRLLRSKGRVSGQIMSTEESSQDRLRILDKGVPVTGVKPEGFQAISRNKGGAEDNKPNTSRAADHAIHQISSNNKFASLINIGHVPNIKDKPFNRRTPSNIGGLQKSSCHTGSNEEKIKHKSRGPALAQKFKNLRLQLDDKEAPVPMNTEVTANTDSGNPQIGQTTTSLQQQTNKLNVTVLKETTGLSQFTANGHPGALPILQSQANDYSNFMEVENTKPCIKREIAPRLESIKNELDELPAAKPLGSNDSSMSGRLDIPFIWDYLLSTEVLSC